MTPWWDGFVMGAWFGYTIFVIIPGFVRDWRKLR